MNKDDLQLHVVMGRNFATEYHTHAVGEPGAYHDIVVTFPTEKKAREYLDSLPHRLAKLLKVVKYNPEPQQPDLTTIAGGSNG